MANLIGKIFLINCVFWTGTLAPAPVFDLQNCINGCTKPEHCPVNSACIPVIGQNCGLCICTVGYTLRDKECVSTGVPLQETFGQRVPPRSRSDEKSSGENSGGGQGSTQSTTSVTIGQQPIQSPSTGGGDSNAEESSTFDCNKYKCDGSSKSASGECSDTPPSSVQCPNLAGGGQCMLGSCLKVNSSLSYCVCPYGRQSRTCHVKKTGNCNSADGKMPDDSVETKGKRFRHIRDPDNGAVLARHSAESLTDCVRLCQWATYQQCRSVNFGVINGQKTCELLTVWANKESILYQWLKEDPDWSYASSSWDADLHAMFKQYDKDNSGELTKQDVVLMLLEANRKQKKDPIFKMNVDFLISCVKNADLDDDKKITYAEFKTYIEKATAQSPTK